MNERFKKNLEKTKKDNEYLVEFLKNRCVSECLLSGKLNINPMGSRIKFKRVNGINGLVVLDGNHQFRHLDISIEDHLMFAKASNNVKPLGTIYINNLVEVQYKYRTEGQHETVEVK